MKVSKISLAILLLVIVLISCKKEVKITNTNQKIEVKAIELNYGFLSNRKIKSITHSCGGGCAITYNEKNISIDDFSIKVEYDAITYINERIEEKFSGSFYVKCNPQKKADFVYYKDEPNKNVLDVKVNSISESFQRYSDELCSCISLKEESTVSSISKIENIVNKEKESLKFPLSTKTIVDEKPYISNNNIENISEYTCGENQFEYFSLKNKWNFDVYIIISNCYDFEYKDLVVLKKNKIISKLRIEEDSWDIDKMETNNVKDQTLVTFSIDEAFNIVVKTKNILNGEFHSEISDSYKITEEGKIEEKE
ncbi:hypothetical protein J2Q11_12880 [Tenacibaculum finnmarkense genomovar finnmarkense]|uniref:hypothetical protein n=1 Tax=Tenacibaculum finnmarkense TaxID=2781243 RepID=UPI001E4D5AFC|nr:hypothetical protein [Tenacibaculum finnmarkense]MCD8418542.1 hypothetical protein [Tenacibaculum finnmarkense genomovar finnmarkense]MCG8186905.1 hypothetical protein [Tenacibaculum finnmarkense genomovar finnmarkense]MCG8203432.1 hypothetical protein [Tenacibaculum finnmarkense genomovar finnmarkense]MCG8210913.1 hypothetical protein [Tenacibaculum finnmarkense genomovar finnmarkense]MCG8213712.1 hypothetical protein [Tenacibaculum finnmarkense genomovar finnmarkense]